MAKLAAKISRIVGVPLWACLFLLPIASIPAGAHGSDCEPEFAGPCDSPKIKPECRKITKCQAQSEIAQAEEKTLESKPLETRGEEVEPSGETEKPEEELAGGRKTDDPPLAKNAGVPSTTSNAEAPPPPPATTTPPPPPSSGLAASAGSGAPGGLTPGGPLAGQVAGGLGGDNPAAGAFLEALESPATRSIASFVDARPTAASLPLWRPPDAIEPSPLLSRPVEQAQEPAFETAAESLPDAVLPQKIARPALPADDPLNRLAALVEREPLLAALPQAPTNVRASEERSAFPAFVATPAARELPFAEPMEEVADAFAAAASKPLPAKAAAMEELPEVSELSEPTKVAFDFKPAAEEVKPLAAASETAEETPLEAEPVEKVKTAEAELPQLPPGMRRMFDPFGVQGLYRL